LKIKNGLVDGIQNTKGIGVVGLPLTHRLREKELLSLSLSTSSSVRQSMSVEKQAWHKQDAVYSLTTTWEPYKKATNASLLFGQFAGN
jgi:hypothetical protein